MPTRGLAPSERPRQSMSGAPPSPLKKRSTPANPRRSLMPFNPSPSAPEPPLLPNLEGLHLSPRPAPSPGASAHRGSARLSPNTSVPDLSAVANRKPSTSVSPYTSAKAYFESAIQAARAEPDQPVWLSSPEAAPRPVSTQQKTHAHHPDPHIRTPSHSRSHSHSQSGFRAPSHGRTHSSHSSPERRRISAALGTAMSLAVAPANVASSAAIVAQQPDDPFPTFSDEEEHIDEHSTEDNAAEMEDAREHRLEVDMEAEEDAEVEDEDDDLEGKDADEHDETDLADHNAQLIKRAKVIYELWESEKRYAHDMGVIRDVYLAPARDALAKISSLGADLRRPPPLTNSPAPGLLLETGGRPSTSANSNPRPSVSSSHIPSVEDHESPDRAPALSTHPYHTRPADAGSPNASMTTLAGSSLTASSHATLPSASAVALAVSPGPGFGSWPWTGDDSDHSVAPFSQEDLNVVFADVEDMAVLAMLLTERLEGIAHAASLVIPRPEAASLGSGGSTHNQLPSNSTAGKRLSIDHNAQEQETLDENSDHHGDSFLPHSRASAQPLPVQSSTSLAAPLPGASPAAAMAWSPGGPQPRRHKPVEVGKMGSSLAKCMLRMVCLTTRVLCE